MKKACLVLLLMLGSTATLWAGETPAETATAIGGGVAHPWKSPYRTAETQLKAINPAD